MMSFVRRTGGVMLLAVTLGLALVIIGPARARAVEVNQPAPDFRLSSVPSDPLLREIEEIVAKR